MHGWSGWCGHFRLPLHSHESQVSIASSAVHGLQGRTKDLGLVVLLARELGDRAEVAEFFLERARRD